MIQEGLITGIRYVTLGSGKACEVIAEVDDRPTSWLPLKSKISSFYKEHYPPCIGDQCIVFLPNGINEDGFVDTNLAYEKVSLPDSINEHTIVKWTSDGTTYTHDTKASKITLKTPCNVLLTSPKITLDCDVVITGSLLVAKEISDVKGNLTSHEHKVVKHTKAIPR
jgi:phage baseplate assembly protein gpV